MIQHLHGDWQFRQAGTERWYPAQVPGCVHLDLLGNELIDDPFYRTNEKDVQWIEQANWEYQNGVDLQPDLAKRKHIQLVFDGLDTYARVTFNNAPILETDNMFRQWRADIKPLLKKAQNRLHVLFKSPIRENLPKVNNLPYRLPACQDSERGGTSVFTRKAPYHYGWDWGPRLVTSGMWRAVKIEAWDHVKISDINIRLTSMNIERATLIINLEILSDTAEKAVLKISDDHGAIEKHDQIELKPGLNKIVKEVNIESPELWWPSGYGEQPLYTITAEIMVHGEQAVASQRVGIRDLKLRRRKDNWGRSFEFLINDIPIYMKGANWIPADSFPPRVTADRYRHLLESAVAANMNMLRVWGGGIYESDEFYNLCDELGILIWQDFMFACSLYPGDEEFLATVREEAIYQVRRLRNHPCLAIWCGNNEMAQGLDEWGWKTNLPPSVVDDYEKLFHGVLFEVCQNEDPTRTYWASSPGSDIVSLENPQDQSRGDIHYWGVWHKKEHFESYCDQYPRFVSEFGFQSFPEMKTIEEFAIAGDHDIFSPVMLAHQRSPNGNSLIKTYMELYYNVPTDFHHFILLSQILQAEGIKTAVEHFRRIRPRCMGSLYWQLNDCWHVASWASIDYTGRWKALHYYAKKFYAPILISPYEEQDAYMFCVVSDEREVIDAVLDVKIYNISGQQLFHNEESVHIHPSTSNVYSVLEKKHVSQYVDPASTFLFCELKTSNGALSENALYFGHPKDMKLSTPKIDISFDADTSGMLITVHSWHHVRNVVLSMENRNGHFDDNYFHLYPNRIRTVRFITDETVDKNEFRKNLSITTLAELMEK